MRTLSYLVALTLTLLTSTTYAQWGRDSHQKPAFTSNEKNSAAHGSINWHTDFERAHQLSQRTGKPLFMLFTGSGWCKYCNLLEKEVLSKKEFSDVMANRMIFVMLDFPRGRNKLPAHIQRQNYKLAQDFNIEGYPTVICLDPKLNQIAVFGYRRGGAKSYAEYVLSLLEDYDELAWQVKEMDKGTLDAEQLENMYQQAKSSGHDDYIESILSAGLKTKENTFFLIEKYREFVESGKSDQAEEVRQTLLNPTRSDHQEASYRVAVIDFQETSEQFRSESEATRIVAPLMGYIEEFKNREDDNMWKVQMMVSQVFASKEEWKDALQYAEASHKLAPDTSKADVEQAIEAIKENLKTQPIDSFSQV